MSRDLLERARQSLSSVQSDLSPHLNRSAGIVKEIKDLNDWSDVKTNEINVYVPDPFYT